MEESRAPYNDRKIPVMVDVCVSVTMHKNVKVCVRDYEEIDYGLDEDGDIDIKKRFDSSVLFDAVRHQIDLPQERVKGWCVDEMEVVEE